VLLVEPNLLGIKETKEILEEIIYKWKINKNTIKVVYNKTNNYSIDKNILKQMFLDFEILGKIKNNYFYNFLINNNLNIKNNKINKEYQKIIKKLF